MNKIIIFLKVIINFYVNFSLFIKTKNLFENQKISSYRILKFFCYFCHFLQSHIYNYFKFIIILDNLQE